MPTSNHKTKPLGGDPAMREAESSLVSEALESTKRLGAYMEEKAQQTAKGIGCGMESLGAAIHENKPKDGILHDAGAAIAAKLESGGQYLESHGLTGVGEDLSNLIRKNPVPALLLGVGMGFLLAKMMKGS